MTADERRMLEALKKEESATGADTLDVYAIGEQLGFVPTLRRKVLNSLLDQGFLMEISDRYYVLTANGRK